VLNSDIMDIRLQNISPLKISGLFMLFFTVMTAQAEMQYVGDTLRVGVRAEADHSLSSIAVIVTGTAVDVLEKKGGFLRIRTQAGVEGWVKSRYLGVRKPAKLVLDEVRKSEQTLKAELEQIKTGQATSKNNGAAMHALQDKANKLGKENRELRGLVASNSASEDNSWLYWFSGILAVGPLGFLLGLLWYRYQIMKKLGGLTL